MIKVLNFVKKRKAYLIVGVVVLAGALYFIFGHGNGDTENFVVKRSDVTQSVILSGKVQTSDKADLGFASAGRIANIFVKNNQAVAQGAVLAQLEIGELLAELKIKQLNSRTSDIELADARDELEKVKKQEDTKVQSAYRSLLTEDLTLTPESSSYTADAPTISGTYDGAEGRYKVLISKDSVTSSDYTILTFGLERTKRILNKEKPTPLGSRGLYISFPLGELDNYDETIWYLDVPNKASSSYVSNLNAYNEAKDSRDLAIKDAEAKYQKLLAADDGGASIAQAEIQKINAEIRKNTIYAPFAGKVTNIEKEVGENASVGERVVSILGEKQLEIVLQVSELDVSRLNPGGEVSLKFDALPGEEFKGTLQTINSRDTEIDGVPVYEAFVNINPDERIKTGMSATGTVILATKPNVLVIPNYFVKKVEDKNFVQVVSGKGKTNEVEVTLGLLGTDSMVEVLSGLREGQEITTSVKK